MFTLKYLLLYIYLIFLFAALSHQPAATWRLCKVYATIDCKLMTILNFQSTMVEGKKQSVVFLIFNENLIPSNLLF